MFGQLVRWGVNGGDNWAKGSVFLVVFGKPYSWGGVLYLLARDFLCAVDKPPLFSTTLSASATFFSTFDIGLFLRRL